MISFDPAQRLTAYLTDVGQVRSENQDACSEFCDPSTGAQLLVVADGIEKARAQINAPPPENGATAP